MILPLECFPVLASNRQLSVFVYLDAKLILLGKMQVERNEMRGKMLIRGGTGSTLVPISFSKSLIRQPRTCRLPR